MWLLSDFCFCFFVFFDEMICISSVEIDVSMGDSDGVKDSGQKKRYANNFFFLISV